MSVKIRTNSISGGQVIMGTSEQKIIPFLWFEKGAVEAAEFYSTVFPNSKVNHVTKLYDTPSGDCDEVAFELWGQQFMAISAGPLCRFNPRISFMINFDPSREANASQMLDKVWDNLALGGKELMPLGEYPFSKKYGWLEDKYGVSWQLILTNQEGEERPPIIPSLIFVGDDFGKAEAAMEYYLSVFQQSERGRVVYFPESVKQTEKHPILFSDFSLANEWFVAMDGEGEHHSDFNESISFIVLCDDQDEIDHYWQQLSAVRESEQCGWLKDQFGISWQVIPRELLQMMTEGSQEAINRVNQATLKMKKIDLATLQTAYEDNLSN